MKPIYLCIEGINSFVERQEIDFDALSKGGLFCITGVTGAGKTTILDSIILALFNEGSSRNISEYVNLGLAEAHIELVFETEHLGRTAKYRVERTFFRSGKGTRSRLILEDTGEIISEMTRDVTNKIAELIGNLSREDFTQVVILEQGKFSRFLSAGKKERASTVGNLFKLNRFKDMFSRVNAHIEHVKAEMDKIDASVEQYKELNKTYLVGLGSELKAAEKEKKNLEKQRAELSKKRDGLRTQKDAFAAYKSALSDVESAKKDLEEKRKNREAAVVDAAGVKERELQIEKLSAQVDALIKFSVSLDKLVADAAKRDRLVIESEGLKTDAVARKEETLALDKERARVSDALAATEKELNRLKSELATFAEIDGRTIRAVATQLKSIYESETAFLSDIQTAEKELAVLAEKSKALTVSFAAKKESEKRGDETVAALDRARKDAEAKLESIRRGHYAHAAAEGLAPGDSCPVCGGIIEKLPAEGGEMSKAQDAVVKAVADYEEKRGKLEELKRRISADEKEIENNESGIREKTAAIAALKERLALSQKPLKVAGQAKTAAEKADKAEKTEETMQDLARQLSDISAKKELAGAKLTAAEEKLTANAKEIAALTAGIVEKCEDTPPLQLKAETDETAAVLKQNIEKEKAFVKGATDRLRTAESAENAAAAVFAAAEKRLPKNPPAAFDENELALADEGLAEIDKKITQFTAAAATLSVKITDGEKNLEYKKQKLEQRKGLEKRFDDLSLIAKPLKGNAFLEFVAEEYISMFTLNASSRLSDMTLGKYSLVYEGGEFYVLDYLSGGEKRSVRTLSGGETFLASLSLAISISEHISRFKNYEFFFLDEGFGTLHSDAIDTVADALTSLAEGTMVGLVSHRSELVERVPSRITVEASTAGVGSKIIIS